MNPKLKDYGKEPLIVNLGEMTIANQNFRTALWTGDFLQITVMCVPPCEEIGLERHEDTDQLLIVMQGYASVVMGKKHCQMEFRQKACEGDVILIPAGMWHNVMNCGREPLKIASVYAPPNHPWGTVQDRREDEAY